jgi:hypothetical protein
MAPIKYNPDCSICRRLAGKKPAGVDEDSLCVGHLRAEYERLRSVLQKLYSIETSEIQRLESVLKRIAEWGCNGQCVELAGIKCPCCIAQEAIADAKE